MNANELRVGLVHWAFPPTVGGVESHLADFAGLLAASGVHVTVFTGTPEPLAIDGVEMRSHRLLDLALDEVRSAPSARDGYDAQVEELASWFEAALPDGPVVIHGHNLHYFSPVPAMALDRLRTRLGIRLLHTYHSVWRDGGRADICRSWDGHYAVSDFLTEQCGRHLGIPARRLYLGVNTARFRMARDLPDLPPGSAGPGPEPMILHPGRLISDKGADDSLRLLDALGERGLPARLVLTGSGDVVDWNREQWDFRTKLDRMVVELGLTGRVEFRSASFHEMPGLYQQADVVVYPSVYPEPLGLAPLEAMCAGRPVVSTRVGGIPETVTDGETGFVVAPGDLDALVDRVTLLLTDRALARRMGRAGRKRVREYFSIDAYLKAMLDEYVAP